MHIEYLNKILHFSSVADPGCLSRIRIVYLGSDFSIPDSGSMVKMNRIPDPDSLQKNWVFLSNKLFPVGNVIFDEPAFPFYKGKWVLFIGCFKTRSIFIVHIFHRSSERVPLFYILALLKLNKFSLIIEIQPSLDQGCGSGSALIWAAGSGSGYRYFGSGNDLFRILP